MTSFRWFPFTRADGARNMAADDVLLTTAATRGIASLRFYGWAQPTVSLGYFQAAAERREHPRLVNLPFVRRPSGGKTLVHHHELTYTLALPAGFSAGWMLRMHRCVILSAFNGLGLAGKVGAVNEESAHLGRVLCFARQTAGDLVCAEHKVVGSAQRKHHGSLLQHGAILLAQSEFTPELPGIKELTGVTLTELELQQAIVSDFQRETGWKPRHGQWLAEEEAEIQEKIVKQYGSEEWNEKR